MLNMYVFLLNECMQYKQINISMKMCDGDIPLKTSINFSLALLYINHIMDCDFHQEIQKLVNDRKILEKEHKSKELSETAKIESDELNRKFASGSRKGNSFWEKIKRFYFKPCLFKMRELQKLVEEKLKENNCVFVCESKVKRE